MSTFRRSSPDRALEARLRSERPRPRAEFASVLAARVEHRSRRAGTGRLALAAVLTAALAAAFGASGGLGYAASAAHRAARAVAVVPLVRTHAARRLAAERAKVDDDTPAQDQYKPGKGCGDKNHVHARENECKKPPKS